MILIETIRGQKFEIPPIWFMRQAGRYLPEYRRLREEVGSFWNLCFSPSHAAEVTLQPINRFDVDAAIIFSDILVVPLALGQKVTFAPNHGPLLESLEWPNFIKQAEDRLELADLQPSYEAISLVRQKLAPQKALIGFAGSPWTVATYMIDQGKENRFKTSLTWLDEPSSPFSDLISLLTKATIVHLINQVQAGANVVQIFDSWAEAVPNASRQRVLIDPLKAIVSELRQRHENLPIIYFGKGVSDLYPDLIQQIPNLTLGVDHESGLPDLSQTLPKTIPLQGNLSPQTLVQGGDLLLEEIAFIKKTLSDRPYIFNLGHGILPTTPIDHVNQMIETVRNSNV